MSHLANLQSRKGDGERELKSYRKRLSQVENIHNMVISQFSDNVTNVNSQCDLIMSNCSSGIKQCANMGIQNNVLRGMKEKSIYSDNSLSEVKDQLNDERNRIRKIIVDLEREITSLTNGIAKEKETQRIEAQKQAEQRARQCGGGGRF